MQHAIKNPNITYRPEIDGLRAIAVLSVLIYHAFPEWLPSGFIGVDIFFVISGYLITSILIKEITSGKFQFATFYERRIRRLLPPLLPVLAVTAILCSVLLSEVAFKDFSRSLKSVAIFLSNWHFLSSISYFDAPGSITPLLHTWSLAVEEQFYFFFPVILIIAIKLREQLVVPLILMLLMLSFTYSVFLLNAGNQDAAFYNSAARFWELSVGSLIAALPRVSISGRIATILEATGIALILCALLTFSHETVFPGPSALLPTVGAGLIIFAQGKGVIALALSLRPLVLIGLISYALYLWHWPLMVAVRLILPTPPVAVMATVIAVSMLLAWISYIFIEMPIRTKRLMTSKRSAWSCAAIAVFGVFFIASVFRTDATISAQQALYTKTYAAIYPDEKFRLLERIEEDKSEYMSSLNLNYTASAGLYDNAKHKFWTCSFDNGTTNDALIDCLVRQAQDDNILVMGDSIGRDTLHALRQAFPENNFLMLHQSGCPPGASEKCFKGQAEIIGRIKSRLKFKAVILSFRYHPKDYQDAWIGIDIAKNLTPNVYLFGVSPVFNLTIKDYIKSLPILEKPSFISESDSRMVKWRFSDLCSEAARVATEKEIKFVNVLPFFCEKGKCKIWAEEKNGELLYWDQQHLTVAGVRSFSHYLKGHPALSEFLLSSTLAGSH